MRTMNTLKKETPTFYLAVLIAISIAYLLVWPFFVPDQFDLALYRFGAGLTLIVFIVILVHYWRKTKQRFLALPIAVLGCVLSIVLDDPIAAVLVAGSFGVLVLSYGFRAAFYCYVAYFISIVFLYIALENPLWNTIINSIRILLFQSMCFLLVYVVISLEKERQKTAELAVSEERTAAARKLHDGLGQQLVAMSMSLDVAKNINAIDSAAAWDEVEQARTLASTALTDLRRWVRALDPPELKTPKTVEQFRDTLQALARAFRGTGLDFHIETPDNNAQFSQEIGELIHITAREGLSNALRHGDPEQIHFQLEYSPTHLEFSVVDFSETPVEHATVSDGYGIRSLRTRAEKLGGVVVAEPYAKGFRLQIRLPL